MKNLLVFLSLLLLPLSASAQTAQDMMADPRVQQFMRQLQENPQAVQQMVAQFAGNALRQTAVPIRMPINTGMWRITVEDDAGAQRLGLEELETCIVNEETALKVQDDLWFHDRDNELGCNVSEIPSGERDYNITAECGRYVTNATVTMLSRDSATAKATTRNAETGRTWVRHLSAVRTGLCDPKTRRPIGRQGW